MKNIFKNTKFGDKFLLKNYNILVYVNHNETLVKDNGEHINFHYLIDMNGKKLRYDDDGYLLDEFGEREYNNLLNDYVTSPTENNIVEKL